MMKSKIMKKYLKRTTAITMCAALCIGAAGCAGDSGSQGKNDNKKSQYQVTEENEKEELTMNNQPQSSYWFPEQLLEWNSEEDPDFAYNVSTVPLAARIDKEKLETVNSTQNKDTQLMAISIMNSSTSGNAPHGLNKFKANTFEYWQYVDKLVYWGGSSGEGLIVPPSPDVTDMGHKNGVPVLGTVFFPQDAAGGKLEWLDIFLKKSADGSFPMADKLIEVAQKYGFDGWFINQETEGTEEEPLTKEHADLMQEFIKAYKATAPELTLVYYDSMTVDGEMDWQNAMNEKNLAFMKDEQGKAVADDMFLNFWWTTDKLADQELLKATRDFAKANGVDPYSLYAGVDIQANGFTTPVKWNLFESAVNSTYTSLGLYCPSWAWQSASDFNDFLAKENSLWVNSAKDPSAEAETSVENGWKGISTYIVEKSAVTSLPFVTNFSLGNGYSFFKDGELISKLDWNNRSISSVLPTYCWIIKNEGTNELTATYDMGNAWYGGNSLKLRGDVEKETASEIKLYSAELALEEGVNFTTIAKANEKTQLNLLLTMEDGSVEEIKGDKKVDKDWTKVTYDVSGLAGKTVRYISYKMAADDAKSGYELHFGNISITGKDGFADATVSDVKVDGQEFDEDAMYAGARLSWTSDKETAYYEVYRINEDKTRSLLGVSNKTCFYVNTLPRTDETNKSNFEIVPVNLAGKAGTPGTVTMEWPDNSLPKANFVASQTLIAPGGSVTFKSISSENTKTVEWTLTGADKESSTENEVTVTYANEGVYDVKMVAKNDSGEAEKVVEGFIVVSAKAAAEQALLSQGKAVEATAYVNDNEAPPFAVDGDVKKKWCATGTPPHELTIDLGAVQTVSAVKISHAEAGGEGADMNTKAYVISVSADGSDWQEAVSITRNTLGETTDTFAPVEARYVKLSVVKPTQGSDTAARIYEVQVYGAEGSVK